MNEWFQQSQMIEERFIHPVLDLLPPVLVQRLGHHAISLFLLAFLVTLILTVLARTLLGASPFYLVRSRFHEIPPMRALLHLAFWTFRGCSVLCGIAILQQGGRAIETWESGNREHAIVASVALLATLIVWKIGSWFHALAINKNALPRPKVSVRIADIQSGISSRLLGQLGLERFPNEYGVAWKFGLTVRVMLAIVFWAIAAVMGLGWLRPDDTPLADRVLSETAHLISWAPHYHRPLLLFPAACCVTPLLALLLTNRDYLMVTFPCVMVLDTVLTCGCIAILLLANPHPQNAAGCMSILAGLHGWRYASDVNRARGYFRMKRIYKPIVERIRSHFSWIAELRERPDCQLSKLNEDDLSQRISQGAGNIEEYGILTTRNYGRFLRISEVQHEPFVAAMFRYQTVRRYVSTSGGTGTCRMLQHPAIPVWDETLFPLHPPSGYVNWTDPLWLDSTWDIVSICGQCGGRGWVERTESENYMDGSGKTQTRSVTKRETCGSCGGSGRLQYTQILNTQWQRLMPTLSAPEVPLPELLDDAEERVYYALPLIEDRTRLIPQGQNGGLDSQLFQDVHEEALKLTGDITADSNRIMEVHSADYLYRADFQITGFHVISIRFPRLLFQRGWFFGARPEFHFPRVPLSWSMLATLTFFPPLALLWAMFCFALGMQLLNMLP